MSSASLMEKRSLKKSHSRHIETSSTSITSAPPTSDSKQAHHDRRTKEKMMQRSRQRESLPDISHRKGNRSVRASNFELSSSANDFECTRETDHHKSVPNKVIKPKPTPPIAANKTGTHEKDDKMFELLKADLMQQQKNTLVFGFSVSTGTFVIIK